MMIAGGVYGYYWQRGWWRCDLLVSSLDAECHGFCVAAGVRHAPISPSCSLIASAQTSAAGEEYQQRLQNFVEELKSLPVAVHTAAANEQHYEVLPPPPLHDGTRLLQLGTSRGAAGLTAGRRCRQTTFCCAWGDI